MKKTHRAILLFLAEEMRSYQEIFDHLIVIFPGMRMGLNSYNVSLLIRTLLLRGYISHIKCIECVYCELTQKGRRYVNLTKGVLINNDKPSGS